MRLLIPVLTLLTCALAHGAPETDESLCGALLLTRVPDAITDRDELRRLIDQLVREGDLNRDAAAEISAELTKPKPVAFAIKGRVAITSYLDAVAASLAEIDRIGHGAYRALRPDPALGEIAKGLSAQVIGLGAAHLLPGAVGTGAAVVSGLVLAARAGRAITNLLIYRTRLGLGERERPLLDAAVADVRRALAADRGRSTRADLTFSLDREYLSALGAADGLGELPIDALARALLRRRRRDQAERADLVVTQRFFQDYEDGRDVLLLVLREVPKASTVGNKIPNEPTGVAIRPAR